MREPPGYKELELIIRGQFGSEHFPVGRRTLPKIKSYIPDASMKNPDQLGLGMGVVLEMKAADNTIHRQGLVVLDKMEGMPGLGEHPLIMALEEIATAVVDDPGFKYHQTREAGLMKRHIYRLLYCS